MIGNIKPIACMVLIVSNDLLSQVITAGPWYSIGLCVESDPAGTVRSVGEVEFVEYWAPWIITIIIGASESKFHHLSWFVELEPYPPGLSTPA